MARMSTGRGDVDGGGSKTGPDSGEHGLCFAFLFDTVIFQGLKPRTSPKKASENELSRAPSLTGRGKRRQAPL